MREVRFQLLQRFREMRLVQIFEMRDGKIPRELVFDMGRPPRDAAPPKSSVIHLRLLDKLSLVPEEEDQIFPSTEKGAREDLRSHRRFQISKKSPCQRGIFWSQL